MLTTMSDDDPEMSSSMRSAETKTEGAASFDRERFLLAAEINNYVQLETMLQGGADVNVTDSSGSTA